MEIIELKNVVIKIKYQMGSVVEKTEDRISELENRSMNVFYLNKEKIPEKKNDEPSLGVLQDNNKRSNFHIIRVTEGDKKESGAETLLCLKK